MIGYKCMYITTVIPIKKGTQKEYLSYFSSEDIKKGTIVSVPIRSKTEDAIVVGTEEAKNLKTEIKNNSYQLKKIIKIRGESPFDNDFFESCEIIKKYTVSNTGIAIKNLIPKIYIENIEKLSKNENDFSKNINSHEKLIFQSNQSDRLAFYKTLIRESFAKKESVFVCLPTIYDINLFKNELSKGIEQYTYIFNSENTPKYLIDKHNECVNKDHPVLIIGTGNFLFIKRNDIRTIILENESSDAYKQFSRPFIDIRNFVEVFSFIKKIKLILGDTILRPETLFRHESGELSEISSPLFRIIDNKNPTIINMSENKTIKEKEFKMISDEAYLKINQAIKDNQSILLFTNRKGLAPITVCNDCGKTLLCPNCNVPVVLYAPKKKKEDDTSRIFMCNKCGKKEESLINCPSCSSWNLVPLGIGTDRVFEEIYKNFPDKKIFQIDKENTKTKSEAKKEINLFYKNPGSFLIGNELIFSVLDKKIDNSIIVSIDGLLSIPNFNINTRIINLIERLKNITNNEVIIQTRNSENKTLESISNGNVLFICRNELKERKIFGYPPFKRLIKLSFEGTAKETELLKKFLEKELSEYEPQIFSAFAGKKKGFYITNTVLKINIEKWPLIESSNKKIDDKLLSVLYSLPPSFSINVDPEDLI